MFYRGHLSGCYGHMIYKKSPREGLLVISNVVQMEQNMKRLYNTTMTVILYDDICTFLQFRMTISHRKLQAAVVEHMNVIFSISNTCRFIAINGKHVLQKSKSSSFPGICRESDV